MRFRVALLILAVVCGVLSFGQALHAPLQFDDIASIARNETIRTLNPATALSPPPGITVSGRPIANFSLALSYATNGLAPAAYRAGNIAIHTLAALLLFFVVRSALGSPTVPTVIRERADILSASVAALWLVHPIQTEAVDYAVQRTELLVSFFYLATMYCAVRAWFAAGERSEIGWSAAAIVVCVLGMGSKEVMATAPIAVVLYDRAFHADSFSAIRSHGRRAWLHAGLLLTLGVLALVAWGARSETVGGGALSWAEYLRSQGWIIPHYLRLVLWPDDLTFDYGMRAVQGFAPTLGLALLSAAGVAAIGAWRWAPWLAFWATWFFLLLAPSSSFVPIQTEIAAERRMHLALAPVLVLLACGFAVALKRARIIPSPRAIAVGAAALVVILAARTAQRSREYNDPERLWAGAIANVPGNPRAYDNLAAVVLAKHPNRFEEPEALWRRAIAIDSTYIPSWTNLADVALQQGRDEEARVLLDRALRIRPDAVDATLRYGGVLVKLGRSAEAIPYLERATAANPTEDGLVTLAIAYLETGRGADAIEPLWRVVRGNPGRLDAAANLGALLAQHGRPSDAIPLLEAVVRVDTTSGGMLALLALSYAQLDRSSEAFSTALRASSRPRLDAPSYEVLGRTMALLHRPADAIQMFGEALRLDPGNTAARDGLAAMRGQPRTR